MVGMVGEVGEGVVVVIEGVPVSGFVGLPRGVRGVLLFGGTFDPPHVGHVELACRARRVYADRLGVGVDRVALVFVPASRSPLKDVGPESSDAQRVEMLRGAIEGLEVGGGDGVLVWTDELDRAGRGDAAVASYTVETVRRARAALDAVVGGGVGGGGGAVGGGGVRLGLLIGADQAVGFHRWKEPRAILGLADVLVLLREDKLDDAGLVDGEGFESLIEKIRQSGAWSEEELRDWRGRVAPVGLIPVSSSMVRSMLSGSRGGDSDELQRVLPAGVLRVIERDGLYRGSGL